MQAKAIDAPHDWYDGFFEGDWIDHVALHIPQERTQTEVEFIVEKLELGESARILDLACGHGRVSLELARRGHRVTGLDLSPRSLAVARDAAEREALDVEWIEADMREIPSDREFDAVVNLFTAYGYFDDEAENERVLQAVARVLAPGGRFLIDTINLLSLAGRYAETLWRETGGEVLWLAEHSFDFLRGRNQARWVFVLPDGTRSELVHSVRTYTPHELAEALTRAGLEVEAGWGDFEGGDLSFQGRRLILLARKG